MARFALTDEYEELYQRGYPHLRRLVTPHPDEADAEKRAEKALDEGDPGRYHVDWPAEVAYRYVRALANVKEFGIGFSARRKAGVVKEADRGIQQAGPVDAAEAKDLLRRLVDGGLNHYGFQIQHGLFLLEAMLGTAATVDTVLERFESMAKLEGKYTTLDEIAYALGFVIRRLDEAARKAAEARVRALVATKPPSITRDFLSYLVGGRHEIESSRKPGLYCMHFCGDPAWIVEIAAATKCFSIDGYHVRVAGDPLLAQLARDARKAFDKHRGPHLLDELAQIASPAVDKVLAAIEQKHLAQKVEAARALRARGGKPAPSPAKPPPKPKSPSKPSARKPAKQR